LRKYSKDFPSEQATHMAIDDCIEHDILYWKIQAATGG
jgi:hypothetical protein